LSPKRCQNKTGNPDLDKRQNRIEISANFSVEWVVFSGIFLSWLLFSLVLCFQGFGGDADAWLMARTAALLRAGEAYDPARSLGNPLWEFLLALLQPGLRFECSNLFNLLTSLVFLWRIKLLIPDFSQVNIVLVCLMLCCLPVFTEGASSSMELMPAWYLWLECLIALRNNQGKRFGMLYVLVCLIRPEFMLILLHGLFRRKSLLPFYLPGFLIWLTSLLYTFGKNPLPFSGLEETLLFYAGRIWFLIRQAGLLLPAYLFLIFRSLWQQDFFLRWSGIPALIFFCFFPFEWAYAFPALFSGLLSLAAASGEKKLRRLLFVLMPASVLSVWISPLSGMAGLYLQRHTMLAQYAQAQAYLPEKPTLLLDGATFLPTDFRLWKRSMQNRLFQKKGSNFFVAERLQEKELDSLRRKGFEIYRLSGSRQNENWLKKETNN